ncbi:MAG: hypothetical protein R6V85_14925 [Polyangia bacterium]
MIGKMPKTVDPARGIIAVALLLAAALAASSCCDDLRIRLGRVRDFLSGVYELTVEVDISGFAETSFDGDVAGWARIPRLSLSEIDADLAASSYSSAQASFDVDWDASSEKIEMLAVEEAYGVGARPLILMKWKGDRFTVDKGVCYLSWVEGSRIELAAAYCGESTGAMYCEMSEGYPENASCVGCDADGQCVPCKMDKRLGACLPPEEKSGSVDIDVDIDIDIDLDVDVAR